MVQSPLTPRHPSLRHPRLYGIGLESPSFNPFISLLKFPASKAPCNKANPPLRHLNVSPLGGFNLFLRHFGYVFCWKVFNKYGYISKTLLKQILKMWTFLNQIRKTYSCGFCSIAFGFPQLLFIESKSKMDG